MKKTNALLSILLTLVLCFSSLAFMSNSVEAAVEGTINVYTRDSASGTREGFEGVIGFKGELTDAANEVSSNGDMAAKVGQDAQAIGYVSLTTDFEANNIRPINYEGVEPTVENTISGDYTLARPFCYVTRAAGDYESQEKEDLVRAFIAFMTESTEGLEAVSAAGGIVDVEAGTPWEELKVNYPIVDQDNSALELVTVGSTSVEKAVNAALENFQPLAGNFQFKMNQTGSGDGHKRVLGEEKDGPNRGDIGFASRLFHEDNEPVADAIASGTMCQDAIVVVVNAENTEVENFAKNQLYAIFTGAANDWASIPEAETAEEETMDGPINVYTRDSASGTREGFEGVIGFKGELTDAANEVSSNGDMAAKVGQDLQAIGYVSLTTDFEANNIRPISYEGVEPTAENTISGEYTLARPFCYVTRAAGDYESQEKEDLVRAFIAFMTESTEGLEAVSAAGGIVDVEAGTPWEELKVNYPIVDQDNSALELVTVGSTSVEKAVNAALENFQPLAGNFQFKMNQTGSGDGHKRVLGEEKDGPNRGDIGFASRLFHEDNEPVADAIASGIMCQDAIVVVVNAENTAVENFTKDDLYAIFTGATAEWAGLKKASLEGPINVYTRDSASGTREGFEGVIGFKGELTDAANEVSSNGDMAAKVGQDLQAIGYVSLTTDFEANNIRPISYEGVEPTAENTISGEYTLARPFCYVTRAAGDYESQEKEDLVRAFIAFMTESTEGLEAVSAAGGIVDVEAGTPWEELKVNYPIVDQDNSALELVTVGSTSVEKAVNAALENFQPLAGNFQFKMNQTGSGDGHKRVLGEEKDGPNRGDIGFASRLFHEDNEPVADAIASGIMCQDAIVVVVNAENTAVENFTKDDLYAIFTGATTDWAELAK